MTMLLIAPELDPAGHDLDPRDGLPVLRLLPPPPSAPPYDDELAVPPSAPGPLPPLRELTRARLQVVQDVEAQQPRRTTPSSALPPVRTAARVLVQGLLEVMAGVRPVRQLETRTSPELYLRLEALAPTGPTGQRGPTGLRSLHVQEHQDGVAEVCATVHRNGRAAALALRLEGDRDRWCLTDVAGL